MLISEENQIQGQNYGNTASSNNFMPFIASNISIINDEAKQKQLLQEDEEEDFLDESNFLFTNRKDVRYMIFYIWWVKIIWYDDLNMLLSRSLLLYRKS